METQQNGEKKKQWPEWKVRGAIEFTSIFCLC